MRVRLEKPSKRRDSEFIAAAKRSRSIHKGLVSPPVTADEYGSYLKGHRATNHTGFFIILRSTDALAGVVNLTEIVRGSFHSAYLGYYAFKPLAEKGLMAEGLELVIRRAFGELKLHRLEANIQPSNEPSLRLVERLGFRREGFSPRYLKVAGRWRDHERWTLLVENRKESRREGIAATSRIRKARL